MADIFQHGLVCNLVLVGIKIHLLVLIYNAFTIVGRYLKDLKYTYFQLMDNLYDFRIKGQS